MEVRRCNRISRIAFVCLSENLNLSIKVDLASSGFFDPRIILITSSIFSRAIFNHLSEFDKKFILKINSEKLSPSSFMENKHLEYIIEKSYSKNSNFSLDLPGPIKLVASKTRITIKKLFEFDF